jgi:hypothetical protein
MVSPYIPESFEGSQRYRIAWAGSRVRGRDRLTTWDGHLELSAGRFVDAVTFAMENPEKGIRERSARRGSWVPNTTGDDDGIDVTIDAAPDAVFRFHSPVIQLRVTVGELADGQTRRFPAGGVDLPRVHAAAARPRAHERAQVRAYRPLAHARPLPSVLDLRDSGGWRAGLDESGLPRPLKRVFPAGATLVRFRNL